MAEIGLNDDIVAAVTIIAQGRRLLYVDGSERDGRIAFENGHALLRAAYEKAVASGSVHDIMLAEYSITQQELDESDADETQNQASAKAMIHEFEAAFKILNRVTDSASYKILDDGFSDKKDFRYKGLPKDAFHVAMLAHLLRLQNSLKPSGIPRLDRQFTKVRYDAIKAIQAIYCGIQEKAINGSTENLPKR
jgi:hypothetical protein